MPFVAVWKSLPGHMYKTILAMQNSLEQFHRTRFVLALVSHGPMKLIYMTFCGGFISTKQLHLLLQRVKDGCAENETPKQREKSE